MVTIKCYLFPPGEKIKNKTKCKIQELVQNCDVTIRKFDFDTNGYFDLCNDLVNHINKVFKLSYVKKRFYYVDDESELIQFSADDELRDGLKIKSTIFKVIFF